MKTLIAVASLCLSSVAFAGAPKAAFVTPKSVIDAPSKSAIRTAASERLNGASMKGAEVKFVGNGEAQVKTMQFAGGPIRAGQKTMKMEPIADVYFTGNKITSVQPVDRIVPLAMNKGINTTEVATGNGHMGPASN